MDAVPIGKLALYLASGAGVAAVALAITKNSEADRRRLLRIGAVTGSVMLVVSGIHLATSGVTLAEELGGRRSLVGMSVMFLLAAAVVKVRMRSDVQAD